MHGPEVVGVGAEAVADAGGEAEHRIVAIPIDIIEFENTLFNDGSSVLMPDRVNDAEADTPPPPGFALIALAYKQFEMDDRKKMLVSGHHDAGENFAENRSLSEFRAKSVLYLLTGNKNQWAVVSAGHHQIIDFKRVMAYFSRVKGWNCAPPMINNEWAEADGPMVQRFFNRYNRSASRAARVPGNFHEAINTSENHLWPERAWEVVYDLYMDGIRRALGVRLTEMNTLRGMHQYANPAQWLSCANRIPVHADFQDRYRGGNNNCRVEILFFNQDINVLTCPVAEAVAERFPMCERGGYELTFCDIEDLNAWPYHLKFTYYNRVKNSVENVINCLELKAYSGNRRQEVNNVRQSFSDGVYTVKVPQNRIRNQIHFGFETVPGDPYPPGNTIFLYTDAAASVPERRSLSTAQVTALTALNRQKYYDLPYKWSTRNYWTRYQDGRNIEGGRYRQVVRRELRLKPHGNNKTKASEPLTFSLDDIVLAKNNHSQQIKDLLPNGTTERNLNNNSRYALFHIEHRDIAGQPEVAYDNKKLKALRIHDPKVDEPSFTDVEFNKNLITDVPDDTRVICFAGKFHDVYDKRSHDRDPEFSFNRDHVMGARLAVLEDTSIHIKKVVDAENDADARTKNYGLRKRNDLAAVGNYEMHYFHNCATLNNKMLAYLIIYWSTRLTRVNKSGGRQRGTVADVTDHREAGMDNAMKRTNKNYLITKHGPPPAPPPPDADPVPDPHDIIIRPFHFYECKRDGRGGKAKAVTNIILNSLSGGGAAGAWMMPTEAQLRARDFQDDPNYFATPDPDNNLADTDGNTFNVLTNHHEFGHATGNWDDYLYDFEDSSSNNWDDLPKYNQPYTAEGGPYVCDKLSRMRINRTPRMRDFWKFVCWLHDDSVDNTKPLHLFFHNTEFKLTYKATGALTHNFLLDDAHRNVAEAARTEINYAIVPNVACDLLLYKLGDGELSRMIHAGQVFDSILVVRTKLAIKYDINPTAWDFTTARAWAQNLNTAVGTMLNDKFRIGCTTVDNGFKNIYLYFVPHYQVYELDTTGSVPAFSYAGAAPGDAHFDLRVKFQDGHATAVAAKVINVDWGDVADSGADLRTRLIRRLFGKTGTGNLVKADFARIVAWVQSHYGDAGNAYAIHDL
ncbi:MAG: hypothetical protein ABIE07_05945 [Candidatus Zixiibacteriota bacterium]